MAIACAGSATADPALNGVFAMDGGDDITEVTVASVCGPSGCTGTVVSNLGWSSPAKYQNGRWYFAYSRPDGFVCPDRTLAPVTVHYSVDPVAMTGVMSADSNGDCPGGVITETPFRFHRVG